MPGSTSQTPDLLWSAIDWAVKGAGALLLLILSIGWKDYRNKMNQITQLEKAVEVLKTEIDWLKGKRHE